MSTRSWLLTTIQSPFNHIFRFWYWWRHLMPSQICSMTHYVYRMYELNDDLKLCVSQEMLWLSINRVYKMFDYFAGDANSLLSLGGRGGFLFKQLRRGCQAISGHFIRLRCLEELSWEEEIFVGVYISALNSLLWFV